MNWHHKVEAAREVLRRIPACTASGMAYQLRCNIAQAELLLAAAKAPPIPRPKRPRVKSFWSFREGDRCRVKLRGLVPMLDQSEEATILAKSDFSNGFGIVVPTSLGLFPQHMVELLDVAD